MRINPNDRVGHQQAIVRFLDIYRQSCTEVQLWLMFRLTLAVRKGMTGMKFNGRIGFIFMSC